MNFFLFFWECSNVDQVETIPEKKFFIISFSDFPIPVWLEMMPEWPFFFWIFFEFFYYVFGKALAWIRRNGTRNEIFYISFSACPSPIWHEMKPKWRILIFWIFLLFVWKCSSPGREETTLGMKNFSSLFLLVPAWFG